jgi:hypothetical protein
MKKHPKHYTPEEKVAVLSGTWWKECRSQTCVTGGGSSRRYSIAGRRSFSRTELRLSSSEGVRTISPNRNESRIWSFPSLRGRPEAAALRAHRFEQASCNG